MKRIYGNVLGRILLAMVMIMGIWSPSTAAVHFGPYEAVTINGDVIRGVKVDGGQKIWLLLNPAYLDREIVVKISNEKGAGYREWHHGGLELVSPAGQDKKANQWTDWIQVKAPYIEYWMNGQMILHLKKVE